MTGKKSSLGPGEWRWIDKGIFVRGSKHGDRYGISYTDPDTRRRVRKLVGDRVTTARHELEVVRGRIREGTLPKKFKNPRFTDFAEEYLSHVEHTKRSWLRDEVCVRRFVALFGAQPLDSITTHQVELYKTRRSRDCVPRTDRQIMPRTVNLELNVLKRMFNLAIRWEYTDSNPVRGVEALKERQKPMRVLSPAEEEKLLEAASPHLRRVVRFALNTGCRRGEILNLRWADIDLKAGTITLSETKTDRVRTVYINPEVRAILRECGLNQGGYVFGYRGKSVQRLATAWRNAVKKSGIAPIRFHDLRHCAATRLLRAGADVCTVQKVLGHSRLETTTRYLHSDESAQRAAMNALCTTQVAPK